MSNEERGPGGQTGGWGTGRVGMDGHRNDGQECVGAYNHHGAGSVGPLKYAPTKC